MNSILSIPPVMAPLGPLQPEQEQRPIGVTCWMCGLDAQAVTDTAIALGISEPVCCEVYVPEATE